MKRARQSGRDFLSSNSLPETSATTSNAVFIAQDADITASLAEFVDNPTLESNSDVTADAGSAVTVRLERRIDSKARES